MTNGGLAARGSAQPSGPSDTTRAKREFGFTAATSLRDGLERTIEWYRAARGAAPAAAAP